MRRLSFQSARANPGRKEDFLRNPQHVRPGCKRLRFNAPPDFKTAASSERNLRRDQVLAASRRFRQALPVRLLTNFLSSA